MFTLGRVTLDLTDMAENMAVCSFSTDTCIFGVWSGWLVITWHSLQSVQNQECFSTMCHAYHLSIKFPEIHQKRQPFQMMSTLKSLVLKRTVLLWLNVDFLGWQVPLLVKKSLVSNFCGVPNSSHFKNTSLMLIISAEAPRGWTIIGSYAPQYAVVDCHSVPMSFLVIPSHKKRRWWQIHHGYAQHFGSFFWNPTYVHIMSGMELNNMFPLQCAAWVLIIN